MQRQHGLRVEHFQGELLVYDLERHEAHCLNGAAASIWQLCDGATSVAEMAQAIARERNLEADEDLVWRALIQLEEAFLLEAPLERIAPADRERRRALKKLAWAAAVPLVLSIAIPTPTFAQTGPPD
jgi:hypothetical protein